VNFVFHPKATEEFYKAIDYYEDTEPGLGFDFATEVYSAIQRSIAFPYAWPVIEDDIRRALVNRFPFGVLYSFEEERLLVIAVMHLHREPDYWKPRKKNKY